MTLDDDKGQTHELRIKNAYYVPESKIRLLSPQHWAQTSNDNHPNKNGTWCGTYEDRVVLHWNQEHSKKTILFNRSTNNVATMWTTPNNKGYISFVHKAEKN
jgi:hypothetical protein